MNMFESLLAWAPWALTIAILSEAVLLLLRERRARRALEQALIAQTRAQTQLREELQAMLKCSRGLGDRLAAHGTQLRRLAERQSLLERSHGDERHVAASALLATGATPAEIAERCGLSRGEAELMRHLRELRAGAAHAH